MLFFRGRNKTNESQKKKGTDISRAAALRKSREDDETRSINVQPAPPSRPQNAIDLLLVTPGDVPPSSLPLDWFELIAYIFKLGPIQ